MSRQTSARAAGALFLLADVAGVLSVLALRHQGDADFLATAATHHASIVTGSLLILIMCLAMALIPAALFPVLREVNEAFAAGYLVLRLLEAGMVLVGAFLPLYLFSLSGGLVDAGAEGAVGFQQLSDSMRSDIAGPLGQMVWALGFLVLYTVLRRAELVPRWLSLWGLAAAVLHFVGAAASMYALGSAMAAVEGVLLGALAINELVLALWLLVKAFPARTTSIHDRRLLVTG